ncbi:sugar phosphate isomerase/epimerase [Clostridium sp. SYSU_GA19001]|uniref:TIM barrel protein n=1 Tax=Clostridium caldaquaticum TaxID=2940653 RepID=UPI002076F682|nr:TIM barrel protein [Clostridium caldaquaticum]MCM8709936.1 sugar phosphate isomerase/epimerase [Clostridium caldaquaticum]
MAIKRGVSLYSYQQAQFFKQMNWKDMIREVHDNLQTDGIEIIDEAIIRNYPFPSEEFIFDWNNEMARYNMQAVTMDVYLDVHQFRDHIMTHREAAERLKNDIKIAARMGFKNVRALCLVPIDVIEMALETAEKYDVRIGKEIHAPLPIKPGTKKQPKTGMAAALDFRMAEQIIELADRTGSKHVGLVPDFGIFQHSPSRVAVEYAKRHAKNPEVIDFILENSKNYGFDEIFKVVDEKYPAHGLDIGTIERMSLHESSAKPEDIIDIIPYIVSIHGKFYDMTEIPGKPGCYEDKSIDYETPIKYLKEHGFNGYINSEYEGQRDQQDRGIEYLADEVEQVRRHHEMLKRLIGE